MKEAMWMSVGFTELVLVIAVVCMAMVLRQLGRRTWRWAMILAVCLAVATVLTPADPLSTVLVGTLLLGTFTAGVLAAPLLLLRDGAA